jgi:hypothetical protein
MPMPSRRRGTAPDLLLGHYVSRRHSVVGGRSSKDRLNEFDDVLSNSVLRSPESGLGELATTSETLSVVTTSEMHPARPTLVVGWFPSEHIGMDGAGAVHRPLVIGAPCQFRLSLSTVKATFRNEERARWAVDNAPQQGASAMALTGAPDLYQHPAIASVLKVPFGRQEISRNPALICGEHGVVHSTAERGFGLAEDPYLGHSRSPRAILRCASRARSSAAEAP